MARRHVYNFRVQFLEDIDEGMVGLKFELEAGGEKLTGRTGPKGLIDVELPPGSDKGKLKVWFDGEGEKPAEWEVALDGELKPVDDLAGVQQRLNHLGYDAGEPDGKPSDQLKAALRAFQEAFGHPTPSGEADEATRKALDTLTNGNG